LNQQGYKRLTPHERDDAVAWWYIRQFDDGYVFARGGRVAKNRLARKAIRDAYDEAERDHRAFLERPVAILDGQNLLPVNYGYGE
jgi:hypothetical protein